jgi:uncharacterized membrane protein
MMKLLTTYIATLVIFLGIDMIWLNFVAKTFYASELAGLLRPRPILWAAAIFYLLYPLGLAWFGILRNADPASARSALVSGAMFGFFCYLTYDATNYATIEGFSGKVAMIDTLWGAFVSGISTALAVWVLGKLGRA